MPIIKQFQARHNLADMVVVADAGMLSTKNLTALDEAGLRFVVGSRVTKASADLANHFHWHGDAFTDGQLIDTITPRHGNTKPGAKRRRKEPVCDPEQHVGHWRAVWAYSRKRATRDGHTLTAQESRARAVAIARFLQNTTGFSVRKIINNMRPLQDITISLAGQQITAEPELHDDARHVLVALTH